MYVFDLQPQIAADYELGNWFTSTSPNVPFTNMLVMERLAGGRRYKLINRRFFVEARDGEIIVERAIASTEQLREIIDESFRMTLPAPAEEIFCRTAN